MGTDTLSFAEDRAENHHRKSHYRSPVRKYVVRMPGFPLVFFLSSSTVVTWLPDVTRGLFTP
jgi:hypothetical protein